MEIEQAKQDALNFLKEHTLGTLATLAPDAATPHARSVYFASDDAFHIYFVTHTDTRKYKDIQAHGNAAFVISDDAVPRTLQIEGTVENLTKTALIDPALVELTGVLLSNRHYFAPLTHLDPSETVFMKLTPTWVRWGDFSKGHGTDEVLQEIPV